MQADDLMLAAILFFGVSALLVTAANALKLGSIFGFLAAGIALGPQEPRQARLPVPALRAQVGPFVVRGRMATNIARPARTSVDTKNSRPRTSAAYSRWAM